MNVQEMLLERIELPVCDRITQIAVEALPEVCLHVLVQNVLESVFSVAEVASELQLIGS